MAQHEAAHVVVGCVMGLRFRKATVSREWDPIERDFIGGATYFDGRYGTHLAWEIMGAAGIAWSKIAGCPWQWHRYDLKELKRSVRTERGRRAVIRTAAVLLQGLSREHTKVTRALMERDITGKDLAAIARGEAIDD